MSQSAAAVAVPASSADLADDAPLTVSLDVVRMPKPRSGSEVRQRHHVVRMRLDDAERAALEARADASGLTIGAYLRACSLESVGLRSRRRASVDRALLAQTNADLHRVGSNLNQIARTLNIAALDEEEGSALAQAVRELDGSITAAITELSVTLAAIRGAIGYDRQG